MNREISVQGDNTAACSMEAGRKVSIFIHISPFFCSILALAWGANLIVDLVCNARSTLSTDQWYVEKCSSEKHYLIIIKKKYVCLLYQMQGELITSKPHWWKVVCIEGRKLKECVTVIPAGCYSVAKQFMFGANNTVTSFSRYFLSNAFTNHLVAIWTCDIANYRRSFLAQYKLLQKLLHGKWVNK